MNYKKRRDHLRDGCKEKKVEGFLTFDFFDVLYLSGFPSEGCFFLGTKSGDVLFAPLLLAEQARILTDGEMKVVSEKKLLESLQQIIQRESLKRIGYDPSKVSYSLYKAFSLFKSVQWIPLEGFILNQRMIKDQDEILQISQACHITHQSCLETFKKLKENMTEQELAHVLENLFYENGARKVAFETIVAFGEHSSYPHHVVTMKKLKKNSPVLMDLGCMVNGYRSDLTRTSVFGKITPQFHKIYEIVKKAQAEGISLVQHGISAGHVDAACRDFIAKAGFADFFIHGTGHGVGLEIHEPPRLGMGSKEILKEGMVVTVEPGIYLPGEFGVRIEDTLLVKKNGCEVLTK